MIGSLIGIIVFAVIVIYLAKFAYRFAIGRSRRPVVNVHINYPYVQSAPISEGPLTSPNNDGHDYRPVRFDEPIHFPDKSSSRNMDLPAPDFDGFFRDFRSDENRR